MRWSFIAESGGPQRYYRAELMARGLREHGEEAAVWPACFEGEDHTLRGWNPMTNDRDDEPAHIIVARLHTAPSVFELFLRARQAGQVVCVDLDDDVWAFEEWHPAALARFDPQVRTVDTACLQANMAAADVVVAATPHLARSCMTVLDTLDASEVPVAAVRSPVVVGDGPSAALDHDPLRVGWLGTWAYRGRDLETITPALAQVLGPRNMIFRHLGRDRTETPLAVLLDMPPYTIWEHDWVDIADLPPLLAELDLAVIPAEDVRFNRSRSATTGLALAAAGVPFVASALPEYAHLAETGIGLTASTPEEWAERLAELADNPRFRRAVGGSGREVAAARYAPSDAATAWLEVVKAL